MAFNRSSFADSVTVEDKIPYCQINNPANLKGTKDIENSGYGILILQEQAEAASFNPDSNWVLGSFSFNENGQEVDKQGYLAKNVKMIVLTRSALEVEKKEQGRNSFANLAYINGIPTPEFEQSKTSDEYGSRIRQLVMFLGADNKPLHEVPFQLTLRGTGTRSALSAEFKELQEEVSSAYFLGKPGQKLNIEASRYMVLSAALSWNKTASTNAPFLVIGSRLTAGISEAEIKDNNLKTVGKAFKVGESRTSTKAGKEVTVTAVPLEEILIDKGSETGQIITRLADTYKSYRDSKLKTVESVAYTSSGRFDAATMNFDSNGSVSVNFNGSDGAVKTLVKPELHSYLDEPDTQYVIKGFLSGGLVTVDSIAIDRTVASSVAAGNTDDIPF